MFSVDRVELEYIRTANRAALLAGWLRERDAEIMIVL